MSSDKHDKTVFRQPKMNPDRTVIRPSPGRRSTTPGTAPPPGQAADAAQSTNAAEAKGGQAGAHYQPDAPSQSDAGLLRQFTSGNRLNPLINEAATLIAVYAKTRKSLSHADIGGLHQRLATEIKQFDARARSIGIAPEVVLSARYCLCTALDEAVLNTPWGSESAWPQRTLLSVFHNETSGGEKFFQILQRMLEQPAQNVDFIELAYVLLSLGFEGKYRFMDRGRDRIEQIRDELFARIRQQRGEYERSLSPSWQGLGKTRKSLASYLPFWVVASLVGVLLLFSYFGFRVWLFDSSTPVVDKLDSVAAATAADSTVRPR